jgi:hypothetical protein
MSKFQCTFRSEWADGVEASVSFGELSGMLGEPLNFLAIVQLLGGPPEVGITMPDTPPFSPVTTFVSSQNSQGRPASALRSLAGSAGYPARSVIDSNALMISAKETGISALQGGRHYLQGNQISGLIAKPGDMFLIPEARNEADWAHTTIDWRQVLYGHALTIPGAKIAVN